MISSHTANDKWSAMCPGTIELRTDITADMRRMYGSVSVSIVRISPDVAREMMKTNTRNRKLNAIHARRLRDVIAAGEWWMNGEAIIFSIDGTLLNGQHRLSAIITSGIAVDVMVVRGIDERAFRTMDGGRVRTTGEVLSMDGERNANNVAAAVQALLTFVDSGGQVPGNVSHYRKATPTLTARVIESHPCIRDSVTAMQKNTLYRTQHSAMLHYLFSLVSPAIANDFSSVMASGHHDMERPLVVFRESLVRTPLRPDLRQAVAARAIKAFNAEKSSDRPKMLRFGVSEAFPTIDGLDYERLCESFEFGNEVQA